jgi:hypothetical protein
MLFSLDIIKIIKNTFLKGKIYTLIMLSLFFTIIYLLLDDTNFSGINKIQQILRDEFIKKEVQKKINIENYTNYLNEEKEKDKDNAIDKTKNEVENAIEDDELTPEKIDQSILQKIFNRLYFSITTGCLLGYGDIYPISNIAKSISMVQSLFTVSLILS